MNKKVELLNVIFLLLAISCWSQTNNIPPTITASGDQTYCPLSELNIVTFFNIEDPDDSEIEALYIQISTGYQIGFDSLILNGNHPNILTSWNVTEGKLTLKGNGTPQARYVDLIDAVYDVVLKSTSNNPTDKFFSFTIGDANYLPSTGHYYQYVSAIGITWTKAKIAAENSRYYGLQGYLATIGSPEEAQLSGEQAAGAGWIGGSDAAAEGVWRWVTGPEAGTVFWNGAVNGSTPNYANWNNNEPNNANGGEDYAHITDPSIGNRGSWNDLREAGDPPGPYHPKGYIVEYGWPNDAPLNISATTQFRVTKITTTKPNSSCGAGSVVLEAYATTLTATVLWYDTTTGVNSIGNGNQFITPIISTTKTYYVLASENGCLEGPRVPVNATIITIPTINSVTGNLVCESGSGTLSATPSSGVVNWYGSPTGGMMLATGNSFQTPIVNTSTTYYVDATFNGCTTAMRTPVTLTVQKTPIPSANANQAFCDIAQATISNLSAVGNSLLWYISGSGGIPINPSDLLTTRTYYVSQTINGCESINRLPVNVIIHETVGLPTTIPDLFQCDSMSDGDDTNGFTTFDLTINESVLLNGKSASDYTFYYFTDSAFSNPIATPPNAFINTTVGGQTIYVRIVNNLNNSCFTDASYTIQVNQLPIVQSAIVFKNCDEDGIPDGFTNYNLEEANVIISNNNSVGLVFTYYMTSNDAEFAVNAISPFYNNTMGNTVYARVENTNNCFRVSTINLQVSTTAFPQGFIYELENCDDDATIDGLNAFNLNQASPLFIAQFPTGQNLSVHYYRNLNDAQLEQNEIDTSSNYTNETSFSQTLYVRVESDDNGDCFGLGPHLLLTVHPRPEFEVDNSAIYCLDNKPVTLTIFNPKGNYTYKWTDGNGQVVSTMPFATVVSGGNYTVIGTSNFGCESFPVTFNVVESALAVISADDVTIVELSNNNSITIDNENNNLGIGDYEFALDNINGPYQDEPYFDHVGAGSHTIYVKDKNLCGIAELEVFILGFPKYFTPNNDGNNDTWQVKGLGTDFSNSSVVNIYDRYGKFIKQLNAKNGFWDGTFNGQPLVGSDYWFVAELIEITGDIKTYRGHFSLVR